MIKIHYAEGMSEEDIMKEADRMLRYGELFLTDRGVYLRANNIKCSLCLDRHKVTKTDGELIECPACCI